MELKELSYDSRSESGLFPPGPRCCVSEWLNMLLSNPLNEK